MKDRKCVGIINGYQYELNVMDYGERLSDYEGFWKWFIVVLNKEKDFHYKDEGPRGGYYDSKEEVIEELLEHLQGIEVLALEEEVLEKIQQQLL